MEVTADAPRDPALPAEPALDLERFAALSAEIEAGASRDELLAAEGLSLEAWTEAQSTWLGKMAEEAARKRFELTNRYNAAFVARRRELDGARKAKRRGKGKTETKGFAAPPPIDAPPPSFSAPSFAAPAFTAPAFAAPPIAAPPIAPAFVAPPPVMAPPPVAAPPFVAPPAAMAAPAPPAAMSPEMSPFDDPEAGETAMFVAPTVSTRAPLPFQQSDASSRPASAPARTDGLPFASAAGPAQALKAAPAPVIGAPGTVAIGSMDLRGTISASIDLGSTFGVGGSSPLPPTSTPLPFRAGASPAPARAPVGSTTGGLPFRATGSMPVMSAPAPAIPAPPPSSPGGAPASSSAAPVAQRPTRFTLEQFASLTAEIAVAPAAAHQVRARYGLDEASHRAESEEWARRFNADKALLARYGTLFESYRDWLTKQRGPRG